MHAAWFTAAVPDAPTTVLKLRLRPYALGHELLLQRLQLVVPPSGGPSTDVCTPLVLAALICSQTFESACKTLHSPFLGVFLKLWHWRLRLRYPFRLCRNLRRRLCRWIRLNSTKEESTKEPTKVGGPDWPTELAAFAAYRSAGTWMPEINPPKTGRSLKAPWQFRLLTVLMSDLHMTASDALNFPLAFAHALYAAQGDLEGNLDLFGPADQALLDKLAEMDGTQ